MALIKNGEIADDSWTYAGDEDPLADAGPVIVSLERWKAERDTLLARNAPIGVLLASDQSPEDIAEDMDRLDVIALEFPTFTDGRAYSSARMLREQFDYQGEIRAVGNVLRDQYLFMHRCGFDAFEVEDETALEDWHEAIREFSEVYQPAMDRRRTIIEQRHDRSGGS